MHRSLTRFRAHQVAMLLLFVVVTLATWRVGMSENDERLSTLAGAALGLLGLAAPMVPRGTTPRWAALLLGGAMLLSATVLLGWLPLSPGFASIMLTSAVVVYLVGTRPRTTPSARGPVR